MRRILWKKHKKKHLPSNNVMDLIKRDTLRRNVGNCTLVSAPNIFIKKKKKALISMDFEEQAERK
jgi:hypothetical protein